MGLGEAGRGLLGACCRRCSEEHIFMAPVSE